MSLHVLLPEDLALCERMEKFLCTLDPVVFAAANMDPETHTVHLHVGVPRAVGLHWFRMIEIEIESRLGDKISNVTFLRGSSGDLDGRSKSDEQASVS
jgi:hypothetical protein